MKSRKLQLACHYCGRKVECPYKKAPCEVLKGWMTVSYWKGTGSVEHFNFCSNVCLKAWIDTLVPRIPDVFLKSFKEDKS